MGSVFLSVSVPDRNTEHYKNCDQMLIQASLRTFLFDVLGHKHLVFGGDSSIVALILVICEELGIDSDSAVTIFQSDVFERQVPIQGLQFSNYIFVPAAENLEMSLELLSKRMFAAHDYDAAVFIGGGDEVQQECRLFNEAHPASFILPVKSAGGASALIEGELLEDDELLDYHGLFIKQLKLPTSRKKSLAENLKN